MVALKLALLASLGMLQASAVPQTTDNQYLPMPALLHAAVHDVCLPVMMGQADPADLTAPRFVRLGAIDQNFDGPTADGTYGMFLSSNVYPEGISIYVSRMTGRCQVMLGDGNIEKAVDVLESELRKSWTHFQDMEDGSWKALDPSGRFEIGGFAQPGHGGVFVSSLHGIGSKVKALEAELQSRSAQSAFLSAITDLCPQMSIQTGEDLTVDQQALFEASVDGDGNPYNVASNPDDGLVSIVATDELACIVEWQGSEKTAFATAIQAAILESADGWTQDSNVLHRPFSGMDQTLTFQETDNGVSATLEPNLGLQPSF